MAPRGLQYCNVCLQSADSTMCGYFCIAFGRHVARGGSLSSFVGLFTHRAGNVLTANDEIVSSILREDKTLKHKHLLFPQIKSWQRARRSTLVHGSNYRTTV
jgi:hypothetical protein